MNEREFVKIVHAFSVDNGFVADMRIIHSSYRKHLMRNSIRCVSDVLDEIGVNHEVCSLEDCTDVDLKGKILFVPHESNPLRFVSDHCQDTLTLFLMAFLKNIFERLNEICQLYPTRFDGLRPYLP